MFFYIFILFILWLCFGSFSTVLVSRWHSGKGWIATGRSECPHCKHTLTWKELFPVFSWIYQKGRCKNCTKDIPSFYPASELLMWILFAWSWWISLSFWYIFTDSMWWLFLFWAFVTGVYIIYDISYMEIPDQIIVPGILITLIAIFVSLFGKDSFIFFDLGSYPSFHTFLTDHISSAIFAYSFFFLQILIPWSWYLYKKKSYIKILSLFVSYFTFPFLIMWDFLLWKKNIQAEDNEEPIPAWIWWGDLRIAIFIGLTLWWIHTLSTLFFAYIIGSIVGVWILVYWHISRKEKTHEIPFWPFLAAWWILSLTFYADIIDYVNILFL